MRRRDFLKQTAGAGAAALVGPAIVGGADKAGTKNAIVGEGEYHYECTHNWGELPAHLRWETTHGVTIDEKLAARYPFPEHPFNGAWPAVRRIDGTVVRP